MSELKHLRHITVGVAPDGIGSAPYLYALDLASGARAPMRVVMVNDSFDHGAWSFAPGDALSESMERLRAFWDARADLAVQRITKQASKRKVKLSVVREEGRTVDVLLDAEVRDGLVVVGRGETSDEHSGSLGTAAELLVRRCTGAILVTPLDYHEPRRVVAAYAGKALGERVLDLSAELAHALGVGLIVLTVGDDRAEIQAIQQQARDRLSGGAAEVEYVSVLGKPSAAIPAWVSSGDLLVMGPHGRSPLYRMLLGSVTDRVMRAVRVPLVLTAKSD